MKYLFAFNPYFPHKDFPYFLTLLDNVKLETWHGSPYGKLITSPIIRC